jgi:CBS domain-containing protein
MRAENIGALPVQEGGALTGMVTDRDIAIRAVAEGRSPQNTSVDQVMSGNVYYCFSDDEVDTVAQIMAEHQIRRLPVLDRNENLVGMVALADLGRTSSKAAGTALEGVSQPGDKPRR